MLLLKLIAGLVTVAAMLPLPAHEPTAFLTVPQRDEWRAIHDPPSVSVSANGRYLAFASFAPLVPADTNRRRDIYVLDRTTGNVSLETLMADGSAADADSDHPGISADGAVLVYQTNLPSSSAEMMTSHVVVRRRFEGPTSVITDGAGTASPRFWSHSPVVSGDGRIVVFVSSAEFIPSAATTGPRQELYAYDVTTGAVRRALAGTRMSTRSSVAPDVTHDGRLIAFTSTAPGTSSEVWLADTQLNVVRALPAGRRHPNGASWSPAIDATGRYIAFVSNATNLVPGDRNRAADVFVADLRTGGVELVSRSAGGGSANGASGAPALSADGRLVAFQSDASNLICAKDCPAVRDDINLLWDVFTYDLATRTMSRVSTDTAQGWMEASTGPSLDARGDVIAFSSRHPIDGDDLRNDFDLFVRAIGQKARLMPSWNTARESSWRLRSER